jgi:hypothetical protein
VRKVQKAEDRAIRERMKLHRERVAELLALGYSKEEASKIAFAEITGRSPITTD